MKKTIVIFIMLILSAITVGAAEVALVFEFADHTVHTECISVDDGTSGYDIVSESQLNIEWADYGSMGHFLNSINGIAYNPDTWAFWQLNAKTTGNWFSAQFVFDGNSDCWNRDASSNAGHYCAHNGDMLGLKYDSAFPSLPSSGYEFSDICTFDITDIEVKVDGKSDGVMHMGIVGKEAKPGSGVEFKVELENFGDEEIEDATVIVTIIGIDDNSDIDGESKEFDIRAGGTKIATVDIELPVLVDEETYEVLIEVDADAGYEFLYKAFLEVEKENHALIITQAELDNEIVSCEDSVNLNLEVINIGSNDEDDITLEVLAFGDVIRKEHIELNAGDDDDSIYADRFRIDVPSVAGEGSHSIIVKAYYDNKLSAQKVLNIEKQACESVNTEQEDVQEQELEEDSEESSTVEASASQETAQITGQAAKKSDKRYEPVIVAPEPAQTLYVTALLIAVIVVVTVVLGVSLVFLFKKLL